MPPTTIHPSHQESRRPSPLRVALTACLALLALDAAGADDAPSLWVNDPTVRLPVNTSCTCKHKGEDQAQQLLFEPSGLTWDGASTLYAVGDNGIVAKRDVGARPEQPWTCLYYFEHCPDPCPKTEKEEADKRRNHDANDFESVTWVAPKLYVGVEGTAGRQPRIREFAAGANQKDSRFTGRDWDLQNICVAEGSGVESITFVPDPTASKQGFGGYFLASSQVKCKVGGKDGEVFAYDLRVPAASEPFPTQPIVALPISPISFVLPDETGDRAKASSDFYYAPTACVLFVTYDDESPSPTDFAYLYEYATQETGLKGPVTVPPAVPTQRPFLFQRKRKIEARRAPGANTQLLGLEAVTAVATSATSTDLFVGFDMSPKQMRASAAAGPIENQELVLDTVAKLPFVPASPAWCPCRPLTSCASIVDSCGWCAAGDASQAWLGDPNAPTNTTCARWIYYSSDCECAPITSCGDIAGTDCGYCVGVGAMPEADKGTGPKVPSACNDTCWVQKNQHCDKVAKACKP